MTSKFVIGGAQKSGTTALSTFVASHPQITFSSPKETHFFDRHGPFAPGDGGVHSDPTPGRVVADAYRRYFDVTDSTVAVGESTPIYMYWNPCPRRIQAFDPNMKWIILLRDPVERAYSHWTMESGRGRESLRFRDALEAEGQRLSEAGGQHRHWSYVDRGRYSWQLERLFRLFGQDQVLVLLNDDLERRHGETLVQVWRFLSVGRLDVAAQRVFSERYPDMAKDDRQYLSSVFASEIDQLEVLLDRSLSSWT